jgi:hypothetical protein
MLVDQLIDMEVEEHGKKLIYLQKEKNAYGLLDIFFLPFFCLCNFSKISLFYV